MENFVSSGIFLVVGLSAISLVLGAGVGFVIGKLSGKLSTASDRTRLETELAAERSKSIETARASEEKLALLQSSQTELKATFESLSAQALKDNTESFLKLAESAFKGSTELNAASLDSKHRAIEGLFKPLQELLRNLEQRREETFGSISQQIRNLMDQSNLLRHETAKLAQALKNPGARGKWGEIQLRRAVEFAGMLKYCDFEEQNHRETEAGRFRPDMIVKLPNRRLIVVDAKAPLQAYLQWIDQTHENGVAGAPGSAGPTVNLSSRAAENRDHFLVEHAAQLRSHIVQLSRKEYWAQFQPSPDFVLLFLPSEAIYSAALQADPTLLEFGASQRVILANPATLITLLMVVAHGWREAQLAENARQVAELGRTAYERITKFSDHLVRIKRGLETTTEAFNSSVGSLEQMVLPSLRRMRDFGIAAEKELGVLEPVAVVPRDPRPVPTLEGGSGQATPGAS